MLHAVIIDDEENGVKSLELLIEKFVSDVKVVASTSNAVEGIDMINDFRPDIVFLDINMPVLDGFQLLENLSFRKFNLIFTTAHREYGLKALKQNAIDYLLKPIDISELKMSVARVKQKIDDTFQWPDFSKLHLELLDIDQKRVPLPCKNLVDYVPATSIVYIEARSNTSKVMLLGQKQFEVTKPLKDYELLLCKSGGHFLRIHHSYIVNLNLVTRYLKEDGGYVVMQGHKTIPISKSKKDEFLKAINFGVQTTSKKTGI